LRSPVVPYTTLFRSKEMQSGIAAYRCHLRLVSLHKETFLCTSDAKKRRNVSPCRRIAKTYGAVSLHSLHAQRCPETLQCNGRFRSEEHTSELQSPDH